MPWFSGTAFFFQKDGTMGQNMERNTLRKHVLRIRDAMNPEERTAKSRQIHAMLTGHPAVAGARHLFVYVNFRSEVETLDLINHLISSGKTVSVPVTLRDTSRLLAVRITDPESQLVPGCYDIPEPTAARVVEATVDPAEIDTVLLPGSVFDIHGGRLGYGGGFYDRFLSEDAPGALRIGLAFAVQLVERVPVESHDQSMDFLVTEDQIYECRRA